MRLRENWALTGKDDPDPPAPPSQTPPAPVKEPEDAPSRENPPIQEPGPTPEKRY